MGRLICGLAFAGLAQQAGAADLGESFLRGSSTVIGMPSGNRWDGVYFGGNVGMSVPGIDFTNNTQDVANVLNGTQVRNHNATPLGNQDSSGTHFGGFIGYNTQWEGAVLGVEAGYNWLGKSITATNTITGNFGVPNDLLVYSAAGSETARIIDYGTFRLRGGWVANSFIMPYATFGLAVGRMDINRTAVVTVSPTATSPAGAIVPAPFTVSENLNNQFGYGYAAGLGVDFALMSNFFLRAEYEYVQFMDFQGLNAHLHNVRVGAALKF